MKKLICFQHKAKASNRFHIRTKTTSRQSARLTLFQFDDPQPTRLHEPHISPIYLQKYRVVFKYFVSGIEAKTQYLPLGNIAPSQYNFYNRFLQFSN